jgi:hypothetical protein
LNKKGQFIRQFLLAFCESRLIFFQNVSIWKYFDNHNIGPRWKRSRRSCRTTGSTSACLSRAAASSWGSRGTRGRGVAPRWRVSFFPPKDFWKSIRLALEIARLFY